MKISKESIYLTFYFFFSILPFTSFQWQFDGYEFPKYLLVILFGVIFSTLLLLTHEIKVPSRFVLFLLIGFLVSTIFSENFTYSFYGDYPRLNQNLVLIFSIIITSVVYKTFLNSLDIFKIIFYQSIFLVFISLFEKNERTISTLGQPNFLGIIIVLGVIYAIKNLPQNYKFSIPILFLIYGLIKTGSITSIICLSFYLIFELVKNFKAYWKYFSLFFLSIILFISFSSTTKNKILDNLNLLLLNKNTVITDSILVRFSIWEDTLKIIFNNPKFLIIGSGPETFSLFYESYRGSKINFTSEWDSLIDKTHNYFLEILLEQGILGLILTLLLFFKYFKNTDKDKSYLSVIILFLFFNWANVFLQLIIFLILVKDLPEEKGLKNNIYLKFILILFILICTISTLIYRFEEIDSKINFFETRNPSVKIYGLDYYKGQELQQYITYLKINYPNNLKIWYEIYKVEKFYNFQNQEITKSKIKTFREDLVEWNEVFK